MAKKAKKVQAPEAARDDALFETLGKNKKRRRRRILFTVISIVLILGIIAVAGVSFLQRRVREQFGSNQGEVLSYEVTTGSMVTITMNAKGEVAYVLISSQSYLGSSGRN
jgi:ferric-dicitrate binding protein FerR (iron transport regulator)